MGNYQSSPKSCNYGYATRIKRSALLIHEWCQTGWDSKRWMYLHEAWVRMHICMNCDDCKVFSCSKGKKKTGSTCPSLWVTVKVKQMSSPMSNKPILAQCQPFSGLSLTMISANIEGFSLTKSNILAELCKQHHCNILCLQETHQTSRHNRPKVPGMDVVAEIPHQKHGSAIYVRSGSPIITSTTSNNSNRIKCLSAQLEGISVTLVYKHPGVLFVFDN